MCMLYKILSRSLVAAGFLAVALLFPAMGAQFRQIPTLPVLPPAIDHPAERQMLQFDLDRLQRRGVALKESRKIYVRDCSQRLTGGPRQRNCQVQLQEIRRESSRLRSDISSLRVRFQTLEANALRRRNSAPAALPGENRHRAADRRQSYVRQALSAGDGAWAKVLGDLKAKVARGPGDSALRDAAAYLDGMYRGRIAADRLDNAYYKHGVRRVLLRDYWSAALAFSRAARDDLGDERVYGSYADSVGRQHASPACINAGRCVAGKIAGWAARFGKPHERALRKLLSGERAGAAPDDFRRIVNILGAITVYAGRIDSTPAALGSVREMADAALRKLKAGNGTEALTGYIRVWQAMEPRRANVFLAIYASAAGSPAARNFMDSHARAVPLPANDPAYLLKIRSAFEGDGSENPFLGALTHAQIIRLQR